MRSLRPLSVVALVAAALVGTTVPASAADAPKITRGTRIVNPHPILTPVLPPAPVLPKMTVIGDSITGLACGPSAQIPTSVQVTTAACFGWPGSTSDEMQAFVENQSFRSAWPGMFIPSTSVNIKDAVSSSKYLVVGLGTNDALRDRAPFNTSTWPLNDTAPVPSGHVPVDNGYFDQKIDYFMKLASGKPVYWYNLGFNGKDPATNYYFSHRNDRLNAAMKRWPNLHVMDWSSIVKAHPEYIKDEVHPNDAGVAARWQLLKNTAGV